ncbi:MAG: MotE family protein [Pseudobdellovibrionaceae bacterium]
MKNGYDQFFKKAQRIAADGQKQAPVARKVQTQDAKILAQELRNRMRPKVQKKKKKPVSWKLAGLSLLGLFIAAAGLVNIEEIEHFAKKFEISVFGSAHAEEAKPAAETAKKGKDEKKEEAPASPEVKKNFSEDDINHFTKLNERKRELDAREEELGRMEQELQAQKAELEKRLLELESTRKNISSVLEEKVQADDKKVDNLVQMYSSMKPQQAAKAFEEMDEGLAIEILGRMKKKSAAEIMNLVKSEKVKILSEKYAGYKRNQ